MVKNALPLWMVLGLWVYFALPNVDARDKSLGVAEISDLQETIRTLLTGSILISPEVDEEKLLSTILTDMLSGPLRAYEPWLPEELPSERGALIKAIEDTAARILRLPDIDHTSASLFEQLLNQGIREIDPYFLYQSASTEAQNRAWLSLAPEKRGSLGVRIVESGSRFFLSPYPDSPAEYAGIVDEDELCFINGIGTYGKTFSKVVSLLRGAPSTSVSLTVFNDTGRSDIEVMRTKSIFSKNLIDPEKSRIRLQDINKEFLAELSSVSEDFGDLLVLDLSSCRGSTKSAYLEFMECFIPPERLLLVRTSPDPAKETGFRWVGEYAKKEPILKPKSIRIIHDNHTASFGELIIAVLKENTDIFEVVTIGKATYGKSLIQKSQRLSTGATIRFSASRMVGPDRKSWEKSGFEPDIAQ